MNAPLQGIKVVELTTFIAAPSCGEILVWMGADVTKIEAVTGEPYRNLKYCTNEEPVIFDALNAGKKSLSVNAKNPEVAKLLKKLVASADVFLTNVREKSLERLGLDYESVKDGNERLVYAHFSGYGPRGPMAAMPGYDGTAYFARFGIYRDFNDPDREPVTHISGFGDIPSGVAMCLNIMSALFRRERTGKGGKVGCALNQTAAWNMVMPITYEQFGTWYQRRDGDPLDITSVSLPCGDGEYIYFNMGTKKQWDIMVTTIGLPELVDDPRCVTLTETCKNTRSLYGQVVEALSKRGAQEWVDLIRGNGCPCERHHHVKEVPKDEQLIVNGFIRKVDYPTKDIMVSVPPVSSEMQIPDAAKHGEALGAHTEEILKSLGCSDELLRQLVESGDAVVS